MKSYHISLALIMFALAIVIVNSSGIFGEIKLKPYDGPDILGVVKTLAPDNVEELNYQILAISTFSFLFGTVSPVIAILAYSAILMEFYLPILGLPQEFTLPLLAGTWISFILGMNQFKGRTSLREQE